MPPYKDFQKSDLASKCQTHSHTHRGTLKRDAKYAKLIKYERARTISVCTALPSKSLKNVSKHTQFNFYIHSYIHHENGKEISN